MSRRPPGGCRKCGKQRVYGRPFLEVWQVKDLRIDFSDVWQGKGLGGFSGRRKFAKEG